VGARAPQAMMHQSSQRGIRARSEGMVRSRSSADTAAHWVAVRNKLIHCSMRLGSPVRRVASCFENRCRSIGSNEWLPERYNSRNSALISSVVAARRGCMVLLLMSLSCSHMSQAMCRAFWMTEAVQRRPEFFLRIESIYHCCESDHFLDLGESCTSQSFPGY
jgi:hypothetical protein